MQHLDYRTRELVETVARQSVRETFRLLGLDMQDQEAVNDFRDDLRFVRAQREMAQKRREATHKGIIGSVFSTAGWALAAAGTALWAMLNLKGGQ